MFSGVALCSCSCRLLAMLHLRLCDSEQARQLRTDGSMLGCMMSPRASSDERLAQWSAMSSEIFSMYAIPATVALKSFRFSWASP